VTRTTHERVFDVPLPLARVWPIVSDSDRANKAIGRDSIRFRLIGSDQDPVPRTEGSMRFFGQRLTWDELPFQWERHRRYFGKRRMTSGPMKEVDVELTCLATGDDRTRVTIRASGEPAKPPAGWLAPLMIRQIANEVAGTVEKVARNTASGAIDGYVLAPINRVDVRRRVTELCRAIGPSAILDRIIERVATVDESQLRRMRPFALARAWGTAPLETLRTFLQAAQAGALELHWDLVCPDCRRTPLRLRKLKDVHGTAHCDVCAIRFGVEMDRHVEVSFRPAGEVLAVDDVVYCMAGPAESEHVYAQALIDPGERRVLRFAAEAGAYQLRIKRTDIVVDLAVKPGAPSQIRLTLQDGMTQPIEVAPGELELELTSALAVPRLVTIERCGWLEDAATAAQLLVLPAFATLFPGEAIARGEQIAVKQLAFVFTDLKGSTSMYERLGDGPAYATVSEHFEFLRDSIERNRGTVVKTIGDAVMAVFLSSQDAVTCALDLQRAVPAFNQRRAGATSIGLKIGVHAGPCVVVNANGATDYFGTTVNTAARVQGLSKGGDIVITAQMLAHPGVAALFAGTPATSWEETLAGLSRASSLTRYQF
jgi:adenylate cyclase